MFTVCPKCELMLIVTAADLRAAQGHVRCGRCRGVFNALESLAETTPQETPAAPAPAPTPAHSSEATEPSASEATGELPRLAPGQAESPPVEAPQIEMTHEVWVEPDASPAEEALEAATADAADCDAELEPPPPWDAQISARAAATPPPPVEPTLRDTPDVAAEAPSAPAEFELERPRRPHTAGWLAGALVLALVLAGQLTNHYRGTLATLPSIGPTVRAFYGALGIPVVPLWNVRAYEARQLGASVSSSHPHWIVVRASIANRGRWPLPLPLLRVMLQDRYGRTIAARDVPPRQYLPDSAPPTMNLPPGARIDARVTFRNPGPQAIGFEIDACLREGANILCAHGAR